MMKRKRKRLVEEFEKLLQEVIPGSYFFSYQQDTINLWWWNRKEPRIDINCGYIIDDFSKTPLPILKVLVEKLTKRKKIKNKEYKKDYTDVPNFKASIQYFKNRRKDEDMKKLRRNEKIKEKIGKKNS